jgi:hypothetical protein
MTLRHYSAEAKNESLAMRAEKVAAGPRSANGRGASGYGHPIRSMRKTASNVDLRRGAAIDENAENVRVAKRGPLSDRPQEIA